MGNNTVKIDLVVHRLYADCADDIETPTLILKFSQQIPDYKWIKSANEYGATSIHGHCNYHPNILAIRSHKHDRAVLTIGRVPVDRKLTTLRFKFSGQRVNMHLFPSDAKSSTFNLISLRESFVDVLNIKSIAGSTVLESEHLTGREKNILRLAKEASSFLVLQGQWATSAVKPLMPYLSDGTALLCSDLFNTRFSKVKQALYSDEFQIAPFPRLCGVMFDSYRREWTFVNYLQGSDVPMYKTLQGTFDEMGTVKGTMWKTCFKPEYDSKTSYLLEALKYLDRNYCSILYNQMEWRTLFLIVHAKNVPDNMKRKDKCLMWFSDPSTKIYLLNDSRISILTQGEFQQMGESALALESHEKVDTIPPPVYVTNRLWSQHNCFTPTSHSEEKTG